MESAKPLITVETTVDRPVEKVWLCWTHPDHVTQWNHASDDWHCPFAENDLREGGKFKFTMAAKNGTVSFDFGGTYTKVIPHKLLEYVIGDGRKVSITFTSQHQQTHVVETFEAEGVHSLEMQKDGWKSILNNFKKHTESV